MNRFEDWPKRLTLAIEAARGRPFAWGEHDCMTFAGGVVHALTGRDPAAAWRGRYHGTSSAFRLMARNGGMAVMVTRALGVDPGKPLQAGRGDVVMRCDELGPALGVSLEAGRAAFMAPAGLVFKPLQECIQSWRV